MVEPQDSTARSAIRRATVNMTKKAFEMLPLAFAMSHGASQRPPVRQP
jgi:hypothetical protein